MTQLAMNNRFVAKMALLAGLDSTDTEALDHATRFATKYAAGVDLIREGDRPGPVFVMLEGWACRYKVLPNGSRQIVGLLMPGDCCDLHIGLLGEMDHSIQTITPAHVSKVDRQSMEALLAQHPAIAKAMYISQLVDEGTMRAWITSMGRRDCVSRLAHLMCELYIRASNVGLEVEPSFAMPLSQVLMSDCLGMTPVHLNRVLKEIRLSGAMTIVRGDVTIADPKMLARLAGFDESYLHRRIRTVA